MKNFKELSFKNVRVDQSYDDINKNRLSVEVENNEGEILCRAKIQRGYLKDFISDYFYTMILENELNYFFNELFSDEDRCYTDKMPLDKYVQYINNKYGEDESSCLNELYFKYCSLVSHMSKNILNRYSEVIILDTIESKYENTGAGTLIVEYLKDKHDFIFLYSIYDSEPYWTDKLGFKEILNGHMYWTNNKELDKIL